MAYTKHAALPDQAHLVVLFAGLQVKFAALMDLLQPVEVLTKVLGTLLVLSLLLIL